MRGEGCVAPEVSGVEDAAHLPRRCTFAEWTVGKWNLCVYFAQVLSSFNLFGSRGWRNAGGDAVRVYELGYGKVELQIEAQGCSSFV